jgi:hypothetical protein
MEQRGRALNASESCFWACWQRRMAATVDASSSLAPVVVVGGARGLVLGNRSMSFPTAVFNA